MAKGTATGYIDWGGKRYDFRDAPAYAEKNWGAGFPKKWFWVVSTSFEGEPSASLTCVGKHFQSIEDAERFALLRDGTLACVHEGSVGFPRFGSGWTVPPLRRPIASLSCVDNHSASIERCLKHACV